MKSVPLYVKEWANGCCIFCGLRRPLHKSYAHSDCWIKNCCDDDEGEGEETRLLVYEVTDNYTETGILPVTKTQEEVRAELESVAKSLMEDW